MRFVALVFPRLAIQLARKANPELIGKPFGLFSGTGDSALLAVVSVEATAAGVEPGMTGLQARQRCARMVIESDNPAHCLQTLDAVASILRTRATSNVAIVSREAIVVELSQTETQFADDAAAARGLLALARSWSGLDVRAAVASSISEALCSARTARRHPVVCEPVDVPHDGQLPTYEPVAASFQWETPMDAATVAARISRAVGALHPVLSAYGHSYRQVRLELEHGPYRRTISVRPSAPIHFADEAIGLLQQRVDTATLEGVTAFRVVLDEAGPSVHVDPWRAPAAQLHSLSGPAVPIQRRLLRAS